jgi:hypothetical protein
MTISNSLDTNYSGWDLLSFETRESILDLVGDPTRTAQVSKSFREASNHSYKILFNKYAKYPRLIELLPFYIIHLPPAEKVRFIYQEVTEEAKSCGIDIKAVGPKLRRLDPLRLVKILKRSMQLLRSKAAFMGAAVNQTRRSNIPMLNGMPLAFALTVCEQGIENQDPNLVKPLKMLDLGDLRLSHLPPQIGNLVELQALNLRNNLLTVLPAEMKSLKKIRLLALDRNPLSPWSVLQVCKNLPNLRTVTLSQEQQGLREMFELYLPHLRLKML